MHNLVGKKFNRLLPITYMGNSKWRCQCDCGNIVAVSTYNIEHGRVQSCGCLLKEIAGKLSKKPPGVAAAHQVFCAYRKSASNRGYEFSITENRIMELIKEPCRYCGTKPHNIQKNKYGNGDFIYNGIDRIDNNLGYTKDNVVPCCKICNRMKGSSSVAEFLGRVDAIYKNLHYLLPFYNHGVAVNCATNPLL